MKLKRKSLLVRWAYLWETNPWRKVSVCALFWRCVLFSPLKIALVLGAVAGVGYFAWVEVIPNWRSYLVVVGLIAVSVLITVLVSATLRRVARFRKTSLLAEYLAAKEARWCPDVELVDDDG